MQHHWSSGTTLSKYTSLFRSYLPFLKLRLCVYLNIHHRPKADITMVSVHWSMNSPSIDKTPLPVTLTRWQDQSDDTPWFNFSWPLSTLWSRSVTCDNDVSYIPKGPDTSIQFNQSQQEISWAIRLLHWSLNWPIRDQRKNVINDPLQSDSCFIDRYLNIT